MIQWGLCCMLWQEPIKFHTATCRNLSRLTRHDQLDKLSKIIAQNLDSLVETLNFCVRNKIMAFRISSALLPLATHPVLGYDWEKLPRAELIAEKFLIVRNLAQAQAMRLSLHPDQFVVPSSPRPPVAAASLRELAHQCRVAQCCGATEINLHLGGVYGNKAAAVAEFDRRFRDWPDILQKMLTLENDDVSYTVRDLAPLCETLSIPLVYDVHHHRCNPDGLSELEASRISSTTWLPRGVWPHFHISSPRGGWANGNPRPHADLIAEKDFPECWQKMNFTLDVEAKHKEVAIMRLRQQLEADNKIG
ncbi:MAG: UV DNA damage repair endonuclease UvsE [Victivallaceae bacterium]